MMHVFFMGCGVQRARGARAAFGEFEEAPITFPPTYKYQPGTQASCPLVSHPYQALLCFREICVVSFYGEIRPPLGATPTLLSMRFLEESVGTLISGHKEGFEWSSMLMDTRRRAATGVARLFAVTGKNDGVAVKGSEGRTCNIVEHGRDRIDILAPNRHQQLSLLPRV